MRARSWLYEVPLFYLLLAALQRSLVGTGWDLARADPHPAWLGVLLFAVRYGLAAGTAAGAASAALRMGSVYLAGDLYRFGDADFYAAALVYPAVGAALGGAAQRLRGRSDSYRQGLEEAERRLRALAEEVALQRKATRAVEQQVVSQMSSLVTLYHGSRELGHLERKQLFGGILDFFSGALQAAKAALYRRDGDRWVLYAQKGWRTGDDFPSSLGYGEGLIGRAGSEDRVVSLRDWFGGDIEKAWEGRTQADAVMAGPLHGDGGEVIGVFAVQELPFLRFNSAAMNLLTLLLDWADEAVAKSLYVEELKSRSIVDESLGVYQESYLKSRAEAEFERSKTYALPFSMLLVGARGLSAAPEPARQAYLRSVARLLSRTCRPMDVVARCGEPEVPFSVLLMTATAEQAGELRERILSSAKRLGLDSSSRGAAPVALRVGVGAYSTAMASLDDLINAARKDLG